MDESYFSISAGESLAGKRWKRLMNIRRVPFLFLLRLFFFYGKKALRLKGSERENADNYYFLTLINCDSESVRIKKNEYLFKTKEGLRLSARKAPSSDLEVFNQIWGRREYAKATDILQTRYPGLKPTIIDAGANAGYTSLFFHSIFPEAAIFSIEPDEGNFAMLKRNIELNKVRSITPVKAGIWRHKCYLSVDRSFRDNREWSIQVKESTEKTDLPGLHLSDVIRDYNIEAVDLLKIDIEGAEKYLFEDPRSAADFLSRTKVMAIEIHDEEVDRQRIYDILRDNGFSYFDFNDLTIACHE